MKHQNNNIGAKLQDLAASYETIINYMVALTRHTVEINLTKIVANE
jgi:hypothetical protein